MWSLRIVGILYLLSGLWCAANPATSANFLGFIIVDQGLTEFFSVYGGLQLGLGAAMILSSLKPQFLLGGLFFALVTSSGLLMARLVALINYGGNEGIYAMTILETVIVIILAIPFYRAQKAS